MSLRPHNPQPTGDTECAQAGRVTSCQGAGLVDKARFRGSGFVYRAERGTPPPLSVGKGKIKVSDGVALGILTAVAPGTDF